MFPQNYVLPDLRPLRMVEANIQQNMLSGLPFIMNTGGYSFWTTRDPAKESSKIAFSRDSVPTKSSRIYFCSYDRIFCALKNP